MVLGNKVYNKEAVVCYLLYSVWVRRKARKRPFLVLDSEAFILNSHLQCVNLQTNMPILAHANNL